MKFTTEKLAKYLGLSATILLGEQPFANWPFKKSLESELDKPLIDYVCTEVGFDFVCDAEDRVQTIFIHGDTFHWFEEGLQDLPFTLSRSEVIAQLGTPAKSGGKVSSRFLGEFGAWDRFARSEYVIHVEYRLNVDKIKRITLMRADVVPT